MSANDNPREVWMDHDGGWEDIVALLILLRSPDVRVKGITITPGISDRPTAAMRTAMLLEELRERDAKICDAIPAGADVLATGPLTRIAANIKRKQPPAKLTWMGGAIHVAGNAKKGAEWNAQADADALAVVLKSGVPLTLCPLDLTNQFPSKPTVVETGLKGVAAEVRQAYGEPHRCWWDELAAASIGSPGLFQSKEILLASSRDGRTFEDKRGRKVSLLTACDAAAFEALLRQNLVY